MNRCNIFRSKIHLVVAFIWLPFFMTAQNGFDNPYDCVYNHLYYLQGETYHLEQSAKSMFPVGDSLLSSDRAIELKQILDAKGLFVYMSQIPVKEQYIDSSTGKNIYFLFPEKLPEIYLERSNERWFYSLESVEAIPSLHKDTYPFGTDRLIKFFPVSGGFKLLGVTTWQLFGLVILIALIVLLHFILSLLWLPLLKKLGSILFKTKNYDIKILHSLSKYVSLVIVFYLLKILLPILQLPIKIMEYSVISINIVLTIIGAILLFKIIDWGLKYLEEITQRTASKMDDQLIPIVSKILKIIIIIFATFHILHIFDVNVTALIAGISIGGLALALAAQDTVKNLIGSVMIFIDQPFQIGDYIEVDGVAGTVQEVGFRSTRILAKDTSIIAIPNSTMSNASVTNKGVRTFRLFETTLGLTYGTKPDLIESFIKGLLRIIDEHPKVHDENYYVHFVKMDASSLNILFRMQLKVLDFSEELKVVQELHLSILRLADEMDVQFAFPSTSIYVESMPIK